MRGILCHNVTTLMYSYTNIGYGESFFFVRIKKFMVLPKLHTLLTLFLHCRKWRSKQDQPKTVNMQIRAQWIVKCSCLVWSRLYEHCLGLGGMCWLSKKAWCAHETSTVLKPTPNKKICLQPQHSPTICYDIDPSKSGNVAVFVISTTALICPPDTTESKKQRRS